jgi:hypothetical protein
MGIQLSVDWHHRFNMRKRRQYLFDEGKFDVPEEPLSARCLRVAHQEVCPAWPPAVGSAATYCRKVDDVFWVNDGLRSTVIKEFDTALLRAVLMNLGEGPKDSSAFLDALQTALHPQTASKMSAQILSSLALSGTSSPLADGYSSSHRHTSTIDKMASFPPPDVPSTIIHSLGDDDNNNEDPEVRNVR